MKKTSRSRKLAIRSETITVLRVLSLAELRAANVVGGSEPNCCQSTSTEPVLPR